MNLLSHCFSQNTNEKLSVRISALCSEGRNDDFKSWFWNCLTFSDWHPLFQIPNSSPDCLCNVLEIIFRKGIHAKNAQKFSSHPAAALWGKNPSELSFEFLQNYKWYGSLISYRYVWWTIRKISRRNYWGTKIWIWDFVKVSNSLYSATRPQRQWLKNFSCLGDKF